MATQKKELSTSEAGGNVEIGNRIKHLLVSELHVDPAIAGASDSTTPLLGRGIGLDSVETVALAVAIEEEFNISVPDADLTAALFATVETLALYISGKIIETNGKGSMREDSR